MSIQKPRSYWLWIAIVFAFVLSIVLAVRLSIPIYQTDLWWHVALGKYILESGSLIIDHSLFTWTPSTSYHVYNAWLAEVILFLTHEYMGGSGLLLLRFAVFVGIVLLAWGHAIRLHVALNPIAWLAMLISLALMVGAMEIKPELFSVGFMSLAVWWYFRMRWLGARAWYLPYFYPLLIVLWINIHGAFFLVALFFIATIVGELINLKYSPSQAMPAKLRKHYFFALGLTLPALLVNPFSYELPLYVIDIVLNDSVVSRERIAAYLPTYIFNSPPLYLLDYLIVAMVIFVFLLWQKLKIRRTDWVIILSFIAYCALYIQMGRVAYFLGPVFLFSSLDLLTQKENSWAWPESKGIQLIFVAVSSVAIGLIVSRALHSEICLLNPVERWERVTDPSTMMVSESANYIEENLSGKKIGNIYEDGGYLMHRFWPEKKIMVDPRAFPFEAWLDSYFDFTGSGKIDQFLEQYQADFWVINYRKRSIFSWFANSPDWSVSFLGNNSAVFVPADEAYGETEISSRIDELNDRAAFSKILLIALELEDMGFAHRIESAASENLDLDCGDNDTYVNELRSAITGVELFNQGNYEGALLMLGKPAKYIHTEGKAADAHLKLAENYRTQGDYSKARKQYEEIFSLLPREVVTNSQAIIDLYNFTLLDWLYHHSGMDEPKHEADKVHWKNNVKFILMNEDILLPEYRFMIDTARAMKAGEYSGTFELVQRNYMPESED